MRQMLSVGHLPYVVTLYLTSEDLIYDVRIHVLGFLFLDAAVVQICRHGEKFQYLISAFKVFP